VLLVRQFRHAVGEELLELPAGTLEPGETPDACAARELVEETGFRARSLRLLIAFWSSPGILREKMHLYFAADLEKAEQHLDEDEVLRVEDFALADALDMIRDGRIADAKTVAGLLYLARFCAEPT
jgi:ADP-ribose pyrophosphatase